LIGGRRAALSAASPHLLNNQSGFEVSCFQAPSWWSWQSLPSRLVRKDAQPDESQQQPKKSAQQRLRQI
jgi:hypothetical protein